MGQAWTQAVAGHAGTGSVSDVTQDAGAGEEQGDTEERCLHPFSPLVHVPVPGTALLATCPCGCRCVCVRRFLCTCMCVHACA